MLLHRACPDTAKSCIKMKNVTLTKRLKQIVDNKRIAVIGIGNVDRADDGFGIDVAKSLKIEFPDRVFFENEGMENIIRTVNKRKDIDFVIFIDAVEAHEKVGTLLIVNQENIEDIRSSHEIPLKLYLSLVEKPCCIIGIQPKLLDFMQPVSEEVESGTKKIIMILTPMMEPKILDMILDN